MLRVLLGGFVVAHGLVTGMIWTMPEKEDAPFRATHSWLFGNARQLAVTIALVAGIGFVVAGVGLIADQTWWGAFGNAAGAVALVLMLLYFTPWLLAGIAISTAILYTGVEALRHV